MSTKVSYILATRNHATTLSRALQNVREFIDETSELIVVDGASTDDTLRVIAENRDIVSTLISEPDQSEAQAYNKGLLAATGEIIKFVTDDDYYYPEAMRKAIGCLLDRQDVDVLMCGGRILTFGEEWVSSVYCPDDVDYFAVSLPRLLELGVCGAGLLIRRRVLSHLGLLDTSYFTPDLEYVHRMKQRGVRGRFYRVQLFDHLMWTGSGTWRAPALARRDIRRLLVADGQFAAAFPWWLREVVSRASDGALMGGLVRLIRKTLKLYRLTRQSGQNPPNPSWDAKLL